MKKRLGEILIEQGVLTEAQLEGVLAEQRRIGGQLGTLLCELQLIDEDTLGRVLAEQAEVRYANLDDIQLDPEVTALVPESLARKHELIAIRLSGRNLTIATSNPTDIVAIDAVQKVTGRFVEVQAAPTSQLLRALNRAYRRVGHEGVDYVVERAVSSLSGDSTNEEGVVELVDFVLDAAIGRGATDLHLEPDESKLRVRFRLDGDLERGPTLPKTVAASVVARIKIMASLDIAESRVPQDGKIRYESKGHWMDLRVSTFPSVLGESVVLRILDPTRSPSSLEGLGLPERDIGRMREIAAMPNGLVLVTGPTGSGKTTTLYALLRSVDSHRRKTITLEDPVEYRLPMITQCQINERAGMTFATGLRAILRHDPDVILVGEMRDAETSAVAVRAALTGHLVLATLHTNDALSTLARLRDLQIEPFLISTCLRIVVAQRLVRQLCPECKTPYEATPEELASLGYTGKHPVEVYRAAGCDICLSRGVSGRAAIFEVLDVDAETAAMLLRDAPIEEVRAAAVRAGFVPFRAVALEQVMAGKISLAEANQVSGG